ncbi:MAG: homocitrate synthase [archaeon]
MIKILDTTLREGEQTPGVSFSVDEKIEIARMLDEFGVDRIEAGHPVVSKKVEEAIRRIAKEGLDAEILTHNRAIRSDIDKSLDTGAGTVAIFLGSSNLHLKDKLHFSKEQAIETVVDTVEYAKSHGLKVRYTPEDATRTDYDYLIKICNAAIDAGAERISLADTLGIMQPHTYYDFVKRAKSDLKKCEIEVHCHNDFGQSVANSIAALRAGADCVHTTVNGLGERTGITDISSFVMAMEILNKDEFKDSWKKYRLNLLPRLSAHVEKISGAFLEPHHPIVGQNSFSHKSGVHTDGVLKNPKTYEAFDPELIGRVRKIIIDKYTGKRAVASKLSDYGIECTDEQLLKIITEIKNIGDERKIVHETEILEIAEKITGIKTEIIPEGVNALLFIEVESHNYTSSVVRKIRNFNDISQVYEITGETDISAYAKVSNIAELNNLIEEFRAIPGIKGTNTKVVLKKYEGKNGNSN